MAKKILIVDDEVEIVGIMKFRLNSWGFEAISAQSGAEALEVLKTVKPDLMILDVMMPGMSGFDVLKNIKARDDLKNIPVIMVSVASSRAEIERGLKTGAAFYFTKPYDATELLAKIKSILGESK